MQTLYITTKTDHPTSIIIPDVSDTSIFAPFNDYRAFHYVLYAIEQVITLAWGTQDAANLLTLQTKGQ